MGQVEGAATGVTVMTGKEKPQVIQKLPAALKLEDVCRVNEIVLLVREAADRHQIVKLA